MIHVIIITIIYSLCLIYLGWCLSYKDVSKRGIFQWRVSLTKRKYKEEE